jgi:hypothetical protein
MAERKPFLLRLDAATLAALQSWAADDLRSVNGQVEFLLRRALRDAGRLPARERGGDRQAARDVIPGRVDDETLGETAGTARASLETRSPLVDDVRVSTNAPSGGASGSHGGPR